MTAQPKAQMLPPGDTFAHVTSANERCPCKPDWKVAHVSDQQVWVAVHRNMDELRARSTWS